MSGEAAYRYDHAVRGPAAIVSLHAQKYLSDSQASFLAALRRAAGEAPGGLVVVDFSRAILVTSGPIGAMVAMNRQLSREGGRIVAAGGGEFARKVLKFAAGVIEQYESVNDALAGGSASERASEEESKS